MSEKVTEEQKRCAHKEGWITSTDGIVCQWCDMPVAQIVDALDAERKQHGETNGAREMWARKAEEQRARAEKAELALDTIKGFNDRGSILVQAVQKVADLAKERDKLKARVQELENRCQCAYREGECPRCVSDRYK